MSLHNYHLPWSVEYNTGNIIAVDREIARTQQGGFIDVELTAFIVRACNCHNELLELLQRLENRNLDGADLADIHAVIAKATGE
jgi:hypothetical protein